MLTFSTPIYELTGINTNICNFDTIGLTEYDNTVHDTGYTYSGLTLVLGYTDFTSHFDTTGHTYSNYILNNDVYEYTGITGELHYFEIYNFYLGAAHYIDPLLSPLTETEVIDGFTTDIIHCTDILDGLTGTCCPTQQVLSNFPVIMITNEGGGTDNCDDFIMRRVPLGWTLDFVFNKNGDTGWTESVFWFTGVRDEYDIENYADNGLSFRFTEEGKIVWMAYRFSGYCDTLSTGYTEMFYIDSGTTDNILCSGGTSNDFNITIVFERYYEYDTECEQANEGGWNDLLYWTGTTEELTRKWTDERNKRLGTLKIFHNGKGIFKIKNFEELVLSERGFQPFTHIVGGGVTGSDGIHEGCFPYTIRRAGYYETPANFIEIRDHYNELSGIYNINECSTGCIENIVMITPSNTPTPSRTPSVTPSITPSLSMSPTPTPSSSPYLEARVYFDTASESEGTIYIDNPQDRIFDITFSYALNANCTSDGTQPNQATTSLSGSTDNGVTEFFIDSITSYLFLGGTIDSQDIYGTFTLSGITASNFQGISIMGSYEDVIGTFSRGGNVTVTITAITPNDGIANVVCNNIYRIGSGLSPELICGPQVTPTPSLSRTPTPTPPPW